MNEHSEETKQIDPVEFANTMQNIATRSQKLVGEFMERQKLDSGSTEPDPLHLTDAFMALTNQMMSNPAKIVQAQIDLWQGYMDIWNRSTQRWLGNEAAPTVQAEKDDRRFRDEAWQENVVFDFIKQSYLLTSRWTQDLVGHTEGLDQKTQQKVDFYTRQFIDAMAPTNFLMTNPEVLRVTMETHGDNLVHGLQNLLEDLERGKGKLSIRMTDPDAFEVGKNIATTPGKVVFQNDLMQLIQYAPTTKTVYRRPLLIVPPWINKFYILDMREKNSFIRWAVSQGFTVFVVSWVNPDEHLSRKSFEDYMLEGPLAALDAIEQATGEKEVNVIGYCIGGTLMAATLAYMTAQKGAVGRPRREDEQARISRRLGDGDDLQHAARQRSDLVFRGEQLPARQGSVSVRSAVLEFGFHPDAGGDAQLLSAQDVSGEQTDRAWRPDPCRNAD